ncbi:MAG: colanic acid biosynthesis glycosyltransferase WcaL, partial [Promethearchaeota archaeon]
MKIAFIVTVFPALSETFILNQITGLLDLGHDVEIFAVTNFNEGKVHPDVIRYGLMERTHYFFDDTVFRNKIIRI